jgi:uncharacterized protein (DUF1697 family)
VSRYVALLRGINVGGKNRLPMVDLRSALVDLGLADVRTYIQSGNVLFEYDGPAAKLEADIEAQIAGRFGLQVPVVVRSHAQLADVVTSAPAGFGADPETYLSDAVFLFASLTPDAAMSAVTLRDGVDQAWPGMGVLYFQRLAARRTQSWLSRLASTPQYQLMTIRNWSTTTKLLQLSAD